MTPTVLKRYLKFFIPLVFVLGFVVRLYKIDNPIADWHSWRQADTSAVTRNFFKSGVNLLLPKYDDLSDVSGKGLLNPNGYRFVEFPLFNLLHYLLAKAFPAQTLEFSGRMTSVLASLLSAWVIYKLTKRHTDQSTGLLAAGFFLFLPYNIYFSRVILPDPLMVTLYLLCLNFFDLWTKNQNLKLGVLTCIFGGLAVLVKPVAVFFLLPIAWYFLRKSGLKILKNRWFWIFNLSFAIPYIFWRAWETRHPEGIPAGIWLLNGDHIRFKGAFFRWIFGERLAKMILGGWGTIAFAAGLLESGFFWPWAAAAGLYLFTFATGNVRHDYYQIPILPIVSILLGIGTSVLWKSARTSLKVYVRRGLLVVSLAFALAFSWYDIRGNYQVNHWEIVHAGQRVDEITPKDAVVVAPYNGDTAFLYQTNRRGFAYLPFPIKDLIDRFNATYFVSVNYDDQTRAVMAKYTVIEEKPEYVIVKLVEPLQPKTK
jgi:hypothetical protein